MSDILDALHSMMLAVVITAVMLIPIVAVAYIVTTYQCSQYSSITGKLTKYAAGSCYILDNSQWYSWEEYKHRLVAKGEMK